MSRDLQNICSRTKKTRPMSWLQTQVEILKFKSKKKCESSWKKKRTWQFTIPILAPWRVQQDSCNSVVKILWDSHVQLCRNKEGHPFYVNPLSPNGDQHQFSSNDIHTMSRD